jgi:DNA-binding HxlR family transcriptional regulator
MKSRGFEGMTCSIASVMGTLGDRWGTIIMRDLILGLTRYDDLRRSSGITNATLSDRLKVLEQNGLIERRQYQSRPDRYEYVPTPMGRDVGLVMQAMVQVGDKWNLPELKGPPVRFVDNVSGHEVKVALVDAETGELVSPQNIRAVPGVGADKLTIWRMTRRAEAKAS